MYKNTIKMQATSSWIRGILYTEDCVCMYMLLNEFNVETFVYQ